MSASKTVVIITFGLLAVFLRCGQLYQLSHSGTCLDVPPPPVRVLETDYLVILPETLGSLDASSAFRDAARHWRNLGVKIIVFEKGLPANFKKESPRSRVIFAGVNNLCCDGDPDADGCDGDPDTRGCGWPWNLKGFPAYRQGLGEEAPYTGRAFLCVKNLRRQLLNDTGHWTSIAQHEIGHALGLLHHPRSLMRAGGKPFCADGFSAEDYLGLYKLLLQDRALLDSK